MGPLGPGPGNGRPSLRTQVTLHVPQVSVHVGGGNDSSAFLQIVIVSGQSTNKGGVESTISMR